MTDRDRDPATERIPQRDGVADHARTGEIVAAPTTNAVGEPTGSPQAKIVAVLGSAAGVTVIGAVITALTGVTLDPVLLTALMGGATGLIATLAGYVTSNRTSAN